jgi:N-glycosidase YbiA
MKPVVINKVSEEWGSLGNMSKHPIEGEVKGEAIIWPRSEHLFQALRLSCAKTREEIRAISNPMAAKMHAKKFIRLNPDKVVVKPMSERDVFNMRLVLGIKLKQHEDVRELLALTGDREIIEDATRRQKGSGLFWGAALQEDGTWKGENWLGKLWMKIREEFLGE